MLREIWKPIPLSPGYEASSLGRVRSVDRYDHGARGGASRFLKGRILSPGKQKGGYLVVNVTRPSGRKVQRVHRLVAEAFLGDPPTPLHEVAHKDGDPSNNRVKNLRWATRSENHADKHEHGTALVGELAPNSKLTNSQVSEIRKRLKSGTTQKEIAGQYGVHRATITKISLGQRYKGVM